MLLMIISFLVGWMLGAFIGRLIVQHLFNNKISPLDKVEEATDYDIMKEFEEAEENVN